VEFANGVSQASDFGVAEHQFAASSSALVNAILDVAVGIARLAFPPAPPVGYLG
jgi:hypothetical protein